MTYHALRAGAGVRGVVRVRVRVRVRQRAGVRRVVVRERDRLAGVHLLAEAEQVERGVRADLIFHACNYNVITVSVCFTDCTMIQFILHINSRQPEVK